MPEDLYFASDVSEVGGATKDFSSGGNPFSRVRILVPFPLFEGALPDGNRTQKKYSVHI